MKDESSKEKIKKNKTIHFFGVIFLIQLIYFGLYLGLYFNIVIEDIKNELMQGYPSISVKDLNLIFISIGILLLLSIISVLRNTYIGNSNLVVQISLFYINILLCFIFSIIYIFSGLKLLPLKIPVENEISSCSGTLAIECAILSLFFVYNIKFSFWSKKNKTINKGELIKLTIILLIFTQFISLSLISHENPQFQKEPHAQLTISHNYNNIQNLHAEINFYNNSNIDSFFMGNTTDGLSSDSAYIIENYSFDYDFSPNPSGMPNVWLPIVE